ncbi:MAG: prepilin-type N-terminal cleavage/methylation domain-containing protein [Verrucomicrobiota bacterium]
MNLRNEEPRTGGAAFTLLELLIVMTVIAILAAISYTAMSSAINSTNRVIAKSDTASLTNAITAYKLEYHVMPLENAGRGESVQTESDAEIMRILVGADPDLNPRGHRFMNVKLAKNDRKGLDQSGNYLDPWGERYGVGIDSNANGVVRNPASESGTLREEAIAWSYGKPARNGQRAHSDKWVKSWEY